MHTLRNQVTRLHYRYNYHSVSLAHCSSKMDFFCTDKGSIWEIKQDQKSVNCVFYHDIDGSWWHPVQSRTWMLLIDLPKIAGMCTDAFRKLNVFKFDLNAYTIISTNNIGNCTIFVGLKQWALLVTPTKISIKRNSMYISYAKFYLSSEG